MHIPVYSHTHTQIHPSMDTFICAHSHVLTCTRVCTHIRAFKHLHPLCVQTYPAVPTHRDACARARIHRDTWRHMVLACREARVCTHTHTHLHTRVRARPHASTLLRTHIYAHTCTHLCTPVRVHTHTHNAHTDTRAWTQTRAHARTSVCMYRRMCVHTSVHTACAYGFYVCAHTHK